ncbi:MAG: type II toxin-antitoxin system RelE/ParE family toxin [Gammaproteobacteria bacterium]
MLKIELLQMPLFKRAYKKLPSKHKKIVEEAITEIIKDPGIGEQKKGDLTGVFLYKFKINTQEMLLAYEWDPRRHILLALGVHENFYRDLKKNLKS